MFSSLCRRCLGPLALAFWLAACLPGATPQVTPSTTITPSSTEPVPAVSSPSASASKRLDPVLYTYTISGPEILELASGLNATELATGKQVSLFKAPEASQYLPIHNVVSAGWSPDGARVLVSFTNYSGKGGSLRVIESDGTVKTALPGAEALRLEYALWSPDGKRLVVRRESSSQTCLVVGNFDGDQLTPTPFCSALEYPRFWSRDGNWLAVYRLSAPNSTGGEWIATEVEGTRQVPLAQLPDVQWYDQRYFPWRLVQQPSCTWSADPQRAKQFSYWRCG